MNLNNRVFRSRMNSENGEVSDATRFHYHQSDDHIWAEYAGGDIVKGHLQGKVLSDGRFEFVYHHENLKGELQAGYCHSVADLNIDGRIVLHEKWQWFTGDHSCGESELVEVYESAPIR